MGIFSHSAFKVVGGIYYFNDGYDHKLVNIGKITWHNLQPISNGCNHNLPDKSLNKVKLYLH